MRWSKQRLLPAALAVLAALACGPALLPPPTQTPLAVTGSPEPTSLPDTGTPDSGAPTPGGAGAAPAGEGLNLDDPALYNQPPGVQTYRTTMEFSFDGTAADGTPISGRVTAQGAHRVDPRETSLTFSSEGGALGSAPQTFNFVQIGNTQYIVSPDGGCLSSGGGQMQNPFGSLLDTGGFLAGQAQRVLPDEVINGVPVNVYEFDASNLGSGDPNSYSVSQISTGRVYVAQQGGYLVRVLMDGVGASEALTNDPASQGNIHYQVDFLDFDQPVAITAPVGCALPATTEFPVLDDAFEVNSSGGLYSYKTNRTFDEAVAFYQLQMPAAGWVSGGESLTPPTMLLFFTRGDEQASITIADEGGVVTVSIASG